MIAVAFVLFAALMFAWLAAPGGKPRRRTVAPAVGVAVELAAHA